MSIHHEANVLLIEAVIVVWIPLKSRFPRQGVKLQQYSFPPQGKDPKPEDLQEFYNNNLIPLVGQMNSWDKEKKYKKRPLCVVYYDVDFGFENRKGGGRQNFHILL